MSRPVDEQAWQRRTAEIMSGMREWRAAHPKATLREKEQELDHRWCASAPTFPHLPKLPANSPGLRAQPCMPIRPAEAAGSVLVAYETAQARAHPARASRATLHARHAAIQCRWGDGAAPTPVASPAGPVVHTTRVSYFSRRTESATFGDLATLELQRRGIEGALGWGGGRRGVLVSVICGSARPGSGAHARFCPRG
jgi:hypothetical protein